MFKFLTISEASEMIPPAPAMNSTISSVPKRCGTLLSFPLSLGGKGMLNACGRFPESLAFVYENVVEVILRGLNIREETKEV